MIKYDEYQYISRRTFRFINLDENDESRKHFNQRLPIKF